MPLLSEAPVWCQAGGPNVETLLTALAVGLFSNEDPCCPVHSWGHRGYDRQSRPFLHITHKIHFRLSS